MLFEVLTNDTWRISITISCFIIFERPLWKTWTIAIRFAKKLYRSTSKNDHYQLDMNHMQQKSTETNGPEKNPNSNSTSASSKIKDWVQIVAILLGGVWAYYVWHNRDWPSLATRQKSESKVTWAHRQNDTIHAEYLVTMTNGGSKAFTIARAHLRVWTLDKSIAFKKDSSFLDANRFIRSGGIPRYFSPYCQVNGCSINRT